jgi:glycosyltransferase involved in cell wall biosynthesis
MMQVLQTLDSVSSDRGGPSRSVPFLCHALAQKGIGVTLAANSGINDAAALLSGRNTELRLVTVSKNSGTSLASIVGGYHPDVLHDNGVWSVLNHTIATLARKTGIPRCVSPRGMLLTWSLLHHPIRKKIAMLLYQRKDLLAADLFFATSQDEANQLRLLGLRQPIAIVPIGVEFPATINNTRPAGKRTALFLSRLHPKKGLHDLINVWTRIASRDWELIIAGPDEGSYGEEMRRLAARVDKGSSIKFVGEVNDQQKWILYCSAEVFILPTYSENFGIAVAEALVSGKPVLTTFGAPWEVLRTEDAGWWIAPGEASLTAALEDALASSESRLQEMGARGKAYAERELSWSAAGEKTIAAYRWLLSGGPLPIHVYPHSAS